MIGESEIFDNLERLTQEIVRRKRELNSQLSRVDKEISDIRHYIEFYPLNACRGYEMAKMLKDCLIERREIKNEAEALDRISRMNIGLIGNGGGRSALEKVKDKQYRPRVLVELFENPPKNKADDEERKRR